ncbi:MAG: YraN family protein [Chlorobi bacterium]|nr:YraN family protein [Chlorobiota bacterium]
MDARSTGYSAERLAECYLIEQGYHIVARNFHFGRYGEIDLVAYDGTVLVFVEVKYRRSTQYGTPEEAVTERKRAQLRRIAEGFLYTQPHVHASEYRFDVIAIEGTVGKPVIRHWKDAFW